MEIYKTVDYSLKSELHKQRLIELQNKSKEDNETEYQFKEVLINQPSFGRTYLNWYDSNYQTNYSIDGLIKGLPINIMRFIASDIAQAVPVMYLKTDSTDNEQLNNHEFIDLLNYPNDDLSYVEMMITICLHKWIHGTALPVVGLSQNFRELRNIELIYPEQFNIQFYNDKITGLPMIRDIQTGNEFERQNVIPIRNIDINYNSYYQINKNYFGSSIIKENEMTLSLYQTITRYQERQLLNDAQVRFIITSDRKYSTQSKKAFLQQWNEQFQGVNNNNKTAFLDEGMKPFASSWNPKDLDINEGLDRTIKQIRNIWGIGGDIQGDTETVNRSTSQQTTQNYYKNVLLPMLSEIEAPFNKYIHKRYPNDNIYLKFVLPRVENEERLKEFTLEQNFLQLPQTTNNMIVFNEYRKYLGYSPLTTGLDNPNSTSSSVIPDNSNTNN